jgi:hypothetical protein
MGFTFTHATLKLLTAGAIASWFSFGMRLLKSSVGTTRTTQLIGHAISEHVRTYEWPVADTQRIYLSAEIRGRIAIPVVLVILGAGVARGCGSRPAGVSQGLFLIPKFTSKFHYTKRKFIITSKYRHIFGVLNVDEIKN